MRRKVRGVAFASSLLFAAAASRAEERHAPPPEIARAQIPRRLKNDSAAFLAAEFGGTVAVAVGLSLAAGGNPTSCGWCETNSFDVTMRNALYLEDSKTPATTSHVLSIGVIPLLSFGAVIVPALQSKHASYALADSLSILNAFVLSTGVNDFVKKLVARERPGFHFGRQSQLESADIPSDRFRSFYSGDTAWAFTIAAAGTTVAYQRGYWTAPFLAASGAVLATTAGALRMAADMHWFSDVLVGAGMGTAVGAAMPLLLHPRRGAEATATTVVPFMTRGTVGVLANGTF